MDFASQDDLTVIVYFQQTFVGDFSVVVFSKRKGNSELMNDIFTMTLSCLW